MKLFVWLMLCFIRVLALNSSMLGPLYNVSTSFHQWLVALIYSRPYMFKWFYAAILFGEDKGIRQNPEISSFIILGLYHVIVVSGSHLIFLNQFIEKSLFFISSKKRKAIGFVFLTVFTMANEWQAACLRAYIQWILRIFFQPKFYNDEDIQIFSICLCLFLDPTLINSISFQLSCAASLGLVISGHLHLNGV